MHVENIHVGDWLIVTSNKTLDEFERHPSDEVFGGPIRVRAINAPYLAISDARNPKLVKTLDTRFWNVSKANPKYVKAFKQSEAAGAYVEPEEPAESERLKSISAQSAVKVSLCRSMRGVKAPFGSVPSAGEKSPRQWIASKVCAMRGEKVLLPDGRLIDPPKNYRYRGNDGGNSLLPEYSGHYWTHGYAIWRPPVGSNVLSYREAKRHEKAST